jgi:hypothetical protein
MHQESKSWKTFQVIIHTTLAMQIAWKMYEQLGFKRSADLDFCRGSSVFGSDYCYNDISKLKSDA